MLNLHPKWGRMSTYSKAGFIYVYTYLFTLGPFTLGRGEGIDQIILEFCDRYKICLAQVGPSIWHMVSCLCQLCTETGKTLTLAYMINLYSRKVFRGGVLKLRKCSHHALLTNVDDDNDHGWMEWFVVIVTRDIIPTTTLAFPELWNLFRMYSGTCFLS